MPVDVPEPRVTRSSVCARKPPATRTRSNAKTTAKVNTSIGHSIITKLESLHLAVSNTLLGPFKCYVMQCGGMVCHSSRGKSTKVYGSMLLALRGGGVGGCQFSRRKSLRNT